MTVALFVPVDRPDRFEKAVAAGADAVIIDLEDAVAGASKEQAREAVRKAIGEGMRAWVRMNAVRRPEGILDLSMLADLAPAGIMIPKVDGAADVQLVATRVPRVPLVALIETLAGLDRVDEIAATHGIWAIALGAYDLCAELGARVTADVLAPLRFKVVAAARRAGVYALDGPFAGLADEAALADDTRRAVDFGFDGKLAVHPQQIGVIRSAFEPSAADLERALTIIAAAEGGGAVRVGDTMIDAPLLAAARRLAARAGSHHA